MDRTVCTECDTGSGYHLSGSLCCDSNVGDFPAPSGCEACANVVGNCATCTVHQDSGVTECVACAAPFELSGPRCAVMPPATNTPIVAETVLPVLISF